MGLVLVTWEGCGLCEKAERALWTLGVPYVRRDVDREPKLAPHTFRVPVLLLEETGEVLLKGAFGEKELLEVMKIILGGEA